jgi:hypothetical protein
MSPPGGARYGMTGKITKVISSPLAALQEDAVRDGFVGDRVVDS